MGWLSNLISNGIQEYEQLKMQEAERQNSLSAYSQFPPLILDNYYSTSRIENISREYGIICNNGAYGRENYNFAGANWFQGFGFTPTGFLAGIELGRQWDYNIFVQTWKTLAESSILFFVSDGEYQIYLNNFRSMQDWYQA